MHHSVFISKVSSNMYGGQRVSLFRTRKIAFVVYGQELIFLESMTIKTQNEIIYVLEA